MWYLRRELLTTNQAAVHVGGGGASPGSWHWANARATASPTGFPGDGSSGDPAVSVLADSTGIYPKSVGSGGLFTGWMAQNNNGSDGGISTTSEHLRGTCGMTAAVNANTLHWGGLTSGKQYDIIVVLMSIGIGTTQSFDVRTAASGGGTLIKSQTGIVLADGQLCDSNGNLYTSNASFMAAVAAGTAHYRFTATGITDIYITKASGGTNGRLACVALRQVD